MITSTTSASSSTNQTKSYSSTKETKNLTLSILSNLNMSSELTSYIQHFVGPSSSETGSSIQKGILICLSNWITESDHQTPPSSLRRKLIILLFLSSSVLSSCIRRTSCTETLLPNPCSFLKMEISYSRTGYSWETKCTTYLKIQQCQMI